MTRRFRSCAAAAAAAALVAVAEGPGVAAESSPSAPPPTAVVIEKCAEALATAVRRHVALELREQSLGDGLSAPATGDRISIVCERGVAWISVRGSEEGDEMARNVALGSFPADAAPRAVALAAIEALAALTRKRAAAKPAAAETKRRPAPVPVVAAAAPVASVPIVRPATVLALSGAWRTFFTDAGLSLWGVALDLDRDIGRRFALGLDLEIAGGGRSQLPFGETTALAGSARASFGVRGRWRALHGVAALGGRLGVARLVGTPPAGSDTVTGDEAVQPWGGPVLALGLLGAYRRIGLRVAAELGYAAFGAEGLAERTVVVAMGGPWINVALGVGFLP